MTSDIKEITANLNLSMAIEDYAKKNGLSVEETRKRFMSSTTIDYLYDFSNGLWGEGPDSIIRLFEEIK